MTINCNQPLCFCLASGFLNKEIEKANINIVDTGESPEAPHPREMIDLEVSLFEVILMYLFISIIIKSN